MHVVLPLRDRGLGLGSRDQGLRTGLAIGTAGRCRFGRRLQRYADRGVFRGFSATRGRGGTQEFRFTWLTREPMVLSHDRAAATLTFNGCCRMRRAPRRCWLKCRRSWSAVGADGRSIAASTRRLDVRCGASIAARSSVVLQVQGPHPRLYAVQHGVNLVHEIFTPLHRIVIPSICGVVRAARGVDRGRAADLRDASARAATARAARVTAVAPEAADNPPI